ncbi:hypothetical protein [Desulfonema limicola]|uniref:hypothetical protein n=1 Tax=Desulfonema limicola TaxID=45656 RepID=UPI001A9B95E7|nr:hypothetical protein [Desulfonema limicola]
MDKSVSASHKTGWTAGSKPGLLGKQPGLEEGSLILDKPLLAETEPVKASKKMNNILIYLKLYCQIYMSTYKERV